MDLNLIIEVINNICLICPTFSDFNLDITFAFFLKASLKSEEKEESKDK